jgi:hypothetical protein
MRDIHGVDARKILLHGFPHVSCGCGKLLWCCEADVRTHTSSPCCIKYVPHATMVPPNTYFHTAICFDIMVNEISGSGLPKPTANSAAL